MSVYEIYAIKYALFRRVLAHGIRRAKKIITVSEYTKQSIQKFFPDVHAEKIHVIRFYIGNFTN